MKDKNLNFWLKFAKASMKANPKTNEAIKGLVRHFKTDGWPLDFHCYLEFTQFQTQQEFIAILENKGFTVKYIRSRSGIFIIKAKK